MLALTKKTGYALVAMRHLATLDDEELSSAREIARRFDVPTSLLMNIMKELASAGYVESVRGARGGYRLAKQPREVSLVDLIDVLEGPVRFAECITDHVDDETECTCQIMASCPIADPIHRVHRRLTDFLRGVSLADVFEPAADAAAPSAEKTSAAHRTSGQ